MKPFKAFLMDRGYDLGLKDRWYVKEMSWGKERNVDVFKLVDEFGKEYQKEIDRLQKVIIDLKREVDFLDEGYNGYKQELHERQR